MAWPLGSLYQTLWSLLRMSTPMMVPPVWPGPESNSVLITYDRKQFMWAGGYKLWFSWTDSISSWMYSVSKVKGRWDCSVVIELHGSSNRPEFCPQYPYQHFITASILHPGELIPSSGLHRYLNSCAHTYTHADVHTRHTNKNKINLKKKKELDLGCTCPLQSGNSSSQTLPASHPTVLPFLPCVWVPEQRAFILGHV